MGALAKLIETKTAPSGRAYSCKIATLCEDDDDRASVAALMTTEGLSSRAIARTLDVSEGTVFKHRSKRCQCYKRGN